MPVFQQQVDAAKALGITPRSLREWEKEPDFPDCSRGYDTDAIQQWRQENDRKGSEVDSTRKRIQIGILAEKMKQAAIKTKMDTLEMETKEGKLIPRKGVELTAQVILSSLSEWCDQLPDLIAGLLPKKHRQAVFNELKRELDKRRIELAAELRSLQGDSR